MHWLIWTAIGLVAFYLVSTVIVTFIIYKNLFLRPGRKGWGRCESMPSDEEYVRLYKNATDWRKKYLSKKVDVDIHNDGYHLFGEYYDFGSERAVIILPGRMEACHYSCHYAEPYRQNGFNVLTIDGRAHGLSNGMINSLGYKEYRDVLAWAEFLHGKMGIKNVVLHGVCIGSSTAVFAAASEDCPEYIDGIVVDGLYQRFYDSYMNHLIIDHRPRFPLVTPELMLAMRLINKADIVHDGPYFRIDRIKQPILFLHSREDKFSTPDKAVELFDLCGSQKKSFSWFEHGAHSRIRITNTEAYDCEIGKYLKTNYSDVSV